MKQKVNVRKRIIISSIILTALLFIFLSPLLSFIIRVIERPANLQNLTVNKVDQLINLSWEVPQDYDIKNFNIYLNNNKTEIGSDIFQYTYNLTEIPLNQDNNLKVTYLDSLNREAEGLSLNITQLAQGRVASNVVNIQGEEPRAALFNIEDNKLNIAIMLAIFTAILTYWIFIRHIYNYKTLLLIGYSALINFSIVSFILVVIFNTTDSFNNLFLSVISSIIFYVLTYLHFLTINILQNSLQYDLPLEQAAKASQFIFSLISTYLVLIIFFSSNYSLIIKVLISILFVFIFTISSLSMIKDLRAEQALVKSISITLVILFSILVIYIWPINYIYSILIVAVFYYILLSVALEVRQKIAKYTWWEYNILIALIFVLLFLSSNWGIRGTII